VRAASIKRRWQTFRQLFLEHLLDDAALDVARLQEFDGARRAGVELDGARRCDGLRVDRQLFDRFFVLCSHNRPHSAWIAPV